MSSLKEMKANLSEKQSQLNYWNGEFSKEKREAIGVDVLVKILFCIFIAGVIIFFTLNIFQFGIYIDMSNINMSNISIVLQLILSLLVGLIFGTMLCLLFIVTSILMYRMTKFTTEDIYFFFFPKEKMRLKKLENNDFSDYPVLQDLWRRQQSLRKEVNDLEDRITEKESYLSELANTWVNRCSDEEVRDFIIDRINDK